MLYVTKWIVWCAIRWKLGYVMQAFSGDIARWWLEARTLVGREIADP